MRRFGFLVALVLGLVGCTSGDDDDDSGAPADDDDAFQATVEYRGSVAILRVGGTPYEMGFQHGTLLRDELLAGAEWLEQSEMALVEPLAETYGLFDHAYASSYPAVEQECQGVVDAMDDPLWDMDRCMLLAYGDPILEFIEQELFGCTQFVAGGDATTDGTLIHGRNMDWTEVRHIIDHPTLVVRFPDEGMPHVVFGFPGSISSYHGMNAAGISIAQNEAHGTAAADFSGRAHSQMELRILREATSLDEAIAIVEQEIHGSAEMFVIADGNSGRAAAIEMAVDGLAYREMSDDGVVYITNHFVEDETAPLHEPVDPEGNSVARWERLIQLLEPEQPESHHGDIDLPTAVEMLRDRYNPITGIEQPPEVADDGNTIGTNGCVQAMVFLPTEGAIYIAEGDVPIPQNPFVGFTLDELFEVEGAAGAVPERIE